jgi:hypothetical protein
MMMQSKKSNHRCMLDSERSIIHKCTHTNRVTGTSHSLTVMQHHLYKMFALIAIEITINERSRSALPESAAASDGDKTGKFFRANAP